MEKNITEYAVLILNYNSSSFTVAAAKSIIEYASSDNYIIQIVDNNSNDDEVQVLNELDDYHIHIDKLATNNGFASGYNQAAKLAYCRFKPKYFVIMNPDIEVTSTGAIEYLIDLVETQDSSIVGAQPIIHDYRHNKNPETQLCLRKVPTYWDLVICESIILRFIFYSRFQSYIMSSYIPYKSNLRFHVPSGAFFVIKADTFFSIKGFDENTFLYAEELIFGKKLRDKDKFLMLEPSIIVRHYQGATTGFDRLAPIRKMYNYRLQSELYYIKSYLGVGLIKQAIFVLAMELGYLIRLSAYYIKYLVPIKSTFQRIRRYWS